MLRFPAKLGFTIKCRQMPLGYHQDIRGQKMNDDFRIFASYIIFASDYGPLDGCFDPFEDEDAIEELVTFE
ncbi:MAG: hypothetical protein CMJ66_00685 [Planctomycetaceae bacterium]|jgi:hypothetical protein|nr:hypothetical protein [Planctomycetaceae bacterium]